jgi:hypothetical protein
VYSVIFHVEVRMGPQELHQPLDPFGGAGFPGDPMERVLSLQSLGDELSEPELTNACNTNVCEDCHTSTCSTNMCQTSSTDTCLTGVC